MRIRTHPLVLMAALLVSGCAKQAQDIAQDLGLIPEECGVNGSRVSATFNDNTYCANAQVIAAGDGSSVMVTGIDLSGATLVIQLDTLATGDHPIDEARNAVLYSSMGSTWTVPTGAVGQLHIEAHDTQSHRLKASFSAPVQDALSGTPRNLEGSLEVTYSTGP